MALDLIGAAEKVSIHWLRIGSGGSGRTEGQQGEEMPDIMIFARTDHLARGAAAALSTAEGQPGSKAETRQAAETTNAQAKPASDRACRTKGSGAATPGGGVMSDHQRENDSPRPCAQCGATGELMYVAHGGGRSGWLHRKCIDHWRVECDRVWHADNRDALEDYRFKSDKRPTSAELARVWLAWRKHTSAR
jgi:hypothetical protein